MSFLRAILIVSSFLPQKWYINENFGVSVCPTVLEKASLAYDLKVIKAPGPSFAETMHGSIEVTLYKQKYASLGITVSGGIDRGYPPRITTIKPGSIADKWAALCKFKCRLENKWLFAIIRCISTKCIPSTARSDCILVNDVIKSINGAETANYTHEQIVKLTKNSDATIRLELEYVLTDFGK